MDTHGDGRHFLLKGSCNTTDYRTTLGVMTDPCMNGECYISIARRHQRAFNDPKIAGISLGVSEISLFESLHRRSFLKL